MLSSINQDDQIPSREMQGPDRHEFYPHPQSGFPTQQCMGQNIPPNTYHAGLQQAPRLYGPPPGEVVANIIPFQGRNYYIQDPEPEYYPRATFAERGGVGQNPPRDKGPQRLPTAPAQPNEEVTNSMGHRSQRGPTAGQNEILGRFMPRESTNQPPSLSSASHQRDTSMPQQAGLQGSQVPYGRGYYQTGGPSTPRSARGEHGKPQASQPKGPNHQEHSPVTKRKRPTEQVPQEPQQPPVAQRKRRKGKGKAPAAREVQEQGNGAGRGEGKEGVSKAKAKAPAQAPKQSDSTVCYPWRVV